MQSPGTDLLPESNGNDYKQFTQRQHVYEIPDTYIGSDEQIPRPANILNMEQMRIEGSTITLPSGVERLFLELTSNAGDNSVRSRQSKINPGKIEIWMDRHSIRVRNGGRTIPIDLNDQTEKYAPEMIFGSLLTSSNYDKTVNRDGNGRNGYGAKLCNIFSLLFRIEIGDASRGKSYDQTWTNNMTHRTDPIIQPYTGPSYVQITYTLDFTRFKYNPEIGYPDEAFGLFAYHAVFLSANQQMPVFFNGIEVSMKSIHNYGEAMYGDLSNINIFLHYEWPVGTEIIKHRHGVQTAKDPFVLPLLEVLAIDTPDAGCSISSINGIPTFNGGFHVDSVYKTVCDGILSVFRPGVKKGKSKDKEESKIPKLTIADVKPHLTLIIIARFPNPKFTSQSKDYCPSYSLSQQDDAKPISTLKLSLGKDDDVWKQFSHWKLIYSLQASIEAKQYKQLSSSDGKKRKHISLQKLKDANFAGTARSNECILYLVEGDSAAPYAYKIFDINVGYHDIIGVFPLKGKPLNVMNCFFQQYSENEEIESVKKILGLREGVDYSSDAEFATLRYNRVMCMPDADVDGKHIYSLVLNLFHCRFPSLLARGYLMHYRSPILRIVGLKPELKFYTMTEYDQWASNHPELVAKFKDGDIDYFKGLGSSTNQQAIEDLSDPRIVVSYYDDNASETMRLAFHDELSDYRKKWIADSIDKTSLEVEQMQIQPISGYLQYELMPYMISNLWRSIPSIMDGLKPGQRKTLWASFNRWESSSASFKVMKNPHKLKVAQLSAFISDTARYHHGETSLEGTIVGMTHDYTGSNNLPYFVADGQFGDRTNGGKASSARYIFTRPQWWLNSVYKREDDPLLTYVVDESQPVEPEFYLPIFPLQVINGANGIGSGWSTFIPCHNPIDVVNWLLARLSSETPKPLIPWYRGFTGIIKLQTRTRQQLSEEVVGDEPSDDPTSTDRLSMMTIGSFVPLKPNMIKITELPIGRWTNTYKVWLDELIVSKRIKDYNFRSQSTSPQFEVIGFSNPDVGQLKLVKSYGMTNMVLLDPKKNPIRHSTVDVIMEEFYQLRLPYYSLRKAHQLKTMAQKIQHLVYRHQFITAIQTGAIIVFDNGRARRKDNVMAQMSALGIPVEIYSRFQLSALSEDETHELNEEIAKLRIAQDGLIATEPAQLWISDLNDFLVSYVKH